MCEFSGFRGLMNRYCAQDSFVSLYCICQLALLNVDVHLSNCDGCIFERCLFMIKSTILYCFHNFVNFCNSVDIIKALSNIGLLCLHQDFTRIPKGWWLVVYKTISWPMRVMLGQAVLYIVWNLLRLSVREYVGFEENVVQMEKNSIVWELCRLLGIFLLKKVYC